MEEIALVVSGSTSFPAESTTLPALNLHEREHLQEWVLAHPGILGPGVRIVATEYDKWESASGERIRDRLDVLGLGRDGRLVVAELKRDAAPATIHMQALNYAAMVSRLEVRDVAELIAEREKKSSEGVLEELTTQWLLTSDSIRNPRVVLIAAGFPPVVTSAALWLNERGVDLSLVKFRAYEVGGQNLVTFSRILPVLSAEAFSISRSTGATAAVAAELDAGPPWDAESLSRFGRYENVSARTLLDLLARAEGQPVSAQTVIEEAGITVGAFRGQLAGVTMYLRNTKKYGMQQNVPPWQITWLSGGVASYTLSDELAAAWTAIRDRQSEG